MALVWHWDDTGMALGLTPLEWHHMTLVWHWYGTGMALDSTGRHWMTLDDTGMALGRYGTGRGLQTT